MSASYGMANAEQLAILTKSVDDYCKKHDITNRGEREAIAVRALQLFDMGIIDLTALANGLETLEDRLKLAS